jgi:hypothetical protein
MLALTLFPTLMACSSSLELVPAFGSARGGDEVVVSGTRMPREAELAFADARATVLERKRGQLVVTTPPGIAGLTPVTLERFRDPAGIFVYRPLELVFEASADWYVPEVSAVRGALAHDLNGDGLDELVLLDEGGLRVFANHGSFDEVEPPSVGNPTGIAARDGVLFVCQADRGSRVLRWDGTLWTDDASIPAEGGCTGATVVDGRWVEQRSDGLRIWEGGTRVAAESTDTACTAESGTCDVQDGIALLSAGAVSWTAPADMVAVRMVLDGQATLVGEDASVPVEGPTAEVELTGASIRIEADRVSLDRIEAIDANGDVWPIADFEVWDPDVGYPGTPVALDGGLAVGGDEGVVWFDSSWALQPGRFTSSCAVGGMAALEGDGDGVPELYVGCEGQDLLYRSDSSVWFEDGAASLPVDLATATTVVAVDLDRDGLDEVLVGGWGAVDRLYHSNGATFEDWSARLPLSVQDTVAVLPTDVDGDGDVDLVLVRSNALQLLVMTGG